MNAPSHRLQWADLPEPVRGEIDGVLGSEVVEAVGQRGGYGPSLAARCGLADGRRVFIKAVSPAQNPDSPDMTAPGGAHRRRASRPTRPRRRCCTRSTTASGSRSCSRRLRVGSRRRRGIGEELDRVVRATRQLGELAPGAPLPTVAEHYGAMFTGWRTLAAEAPHAVDRSSGAATISTRSRPRKRVGKP